MSPPWKTFLSSVLCLTLRMIVMPTIGLSLRSSLHSLQTASFGASGSTIFSTLPLKTPFVSTMRTSDLSFFECRRRCARPGRRDRLGEGRAGGRGEQTKARELVVRSS